MVKTRKIKVKSIENEEIIITITMTNEIIKRVITFNITYWPVFRHLKNQLKELHVILACDEAHKNVFPEVPIIGFKNNKNLKSHLMRAALPDIYEVGRCDPCSGKRRSLSNKEKL